MVKVKCPMNDSNSHTKIRKVRVIGNEPERIRKEKI
jgi:hypothetical protein